MPAKLQNLERLKARYPDLEILIYDDGSDDRTRQMIAASNLNVQVIRGSGRQGKAHGMQTLVKATTREFIVCTDAAVILELDAIDELARIFDDPSVGGVCGEVIFNVHRANSTTVVGGAYWRLDSNIKSLESRSGNVMGAHGALYAMRRDLYPAYQRTLQDDFYPSMAVIFSGGRLVASQRVKGYLNAVESNREEFRRKVRIATGAYHTHLAMKRQLRGMSRGDRWRYYSHKWLRWHSGAFFAISGILGALALALESPKALLLVVLAALVVGSIVTMIRPNAIRAGWSLVVSLSATLLGVLKARAGRTAPTWNPSVKTKSSPI